MNKLLTLTTILFLGICNTIVAQTKLPIDSATGNVVFRTVIQLDTTYKADRIFSIVKEWFSSNSKEFNRSNTDKNGAAADAFLGVKKANSTTLDQLYKNEQPLKLQDATEKKLIGKGVLKYTGTTFGCVRIMYVEYDIKVFVKDYKLKVEVANLNYAHYNQVTLKPAQLGSWQDEGNCSSKGVMENLVKCDKCEDGLGEFYLYLKDDIRKLGIDLKTYLLNNKKSSDGW